MEYKELKDGIRTNLNAAAENFFTVGYCLRQISDKALFAEDGYKSIWEFAKGEYNLSMSSASRFMAINARFSIDGGEHMDQKYIGMGVSKLQEMLSLTDEELEKVTKETTVREIRAMKAKTAEPLSFFGLPATKRPEGSLLTTPGCGDGKHDCFMCSRECGIRQEERRCRTATCGNPFPCDRMGDDFKQDMQHSLHCGQCQMLHPELAPVRAGDKEPDPCCLTCDIKYCFSRCDVAKKRDEQEQKDREAEERRKQRETAEEAEPDIIDADFREVTDEPEARAMTDKEKDALLKEKEPDIIASFYKTLYPGQKEVIKTRKAADITKMLKKEYGEVYESGRDDDGFLWNCYPDKINVSVSGLCRPMQITWGKFTTELLALLKQRPELEAEQKPEEPEPQEQEAEQTEDKEDEDELLCDDCANVSALTGDVSACQNCGPSGGNYKPMEQRSEPEAEDETVEEDSEDEEEGYTPWNVRGMLRDYERKLQAYREVDMPARAIRDVLIIRDALRFLYEKLENEEA